MTCLCNPITLSLKESASGPHDNLQGLFSGYLLQMHPKFVHRQGEDPKSPFPKSNSADAVINVVVSVATNVTRLTLDTDESYSLAIESDSEKVAAHPQGYLKLGTMTLDSR